MTSTGTTETTTSAAESARTSLLDAFIVLAKGKRLILYTTIAATLAAVAISLVIPNTYTGVVKVLPPQPKPSFANALLGQFQALNLGGGEFFTDPNAQYVTMLGSWTVESAIVKRFDLMKVYKEKTLTDAILALQDHRKITSGKDGILTIQVEDRDPARAADIANAYVSEFGKLWAELSASDANQRREFFQQQLQAAQQSLAEAEQALKATQEKTGVIQLDAQAQATIASVANLNAQIAAKAVELKTLRAYATERNPMVQRAQEELNGLREQLRRLEMQADLSTGEMSAGKLPGAGLEYVRRFRQVKYYELVAELLAKQYEAARIDEANNVATVQVLDSAVKPEKKSRPRRGFIALSAFLLSLFLSSTVVFVAEAFNRARKDPEFTARIQMLKYHLRH